MVGITSAWLGKGFKSAAARRYDQGWIDRIRLYVRGGSGGNGLPKVGGIGGNGGSVIIKASDTVKSLKLIAQKNPNKRFIGGDGGHSRTVRLLGESGSNVEVNVPVGVTVVSEHGRVLADLCKHGETAVVAKGGMGGMPSTDFLGSHGERQSIQLDLKLIGDVGFVGFPNAGKSTLLKALSRASPKIASYPFTTIRPNLGICEFEDLRRITFADLPGLIEGAHKNLGMGHSFLKHVERTRALMFVVDINGFQLNSTSPLRSALQTILILNRELELYREDLLDKPAICVISKMDSKNAGVSFEKLKSELENLEEIMHDVVDEEFRPERLIRFSDVIPVSAKFSPKTIEFLKYRVRNIIDSAEDESNSSFIEALSQKVDFKLSEKSKIV